VINGYEYSDLSQQDLDKIRNLETEINNIRETEIRSLSWLLKKNNK